VLARVTHERRSRKGNRCWLRRRRLLRVIEGFTVTPFVIGLEQPRRLLVLPNNDVIVAEQKTGYLTLLRDQDGDGKADYIEC
jgi:glucose/arabinose dehydrogenase